MRLIDADALIENHFSDGHRIAMSYADKAWMRSIIRNEPTIDAVPVVRCGECEYYDYRRCYHPNHDHHEQSVWVEEDHFCGWGQRRGSGDNGTQS